jgi:hypothetical protein
MMMMMMKTKKTTTQHQPKHCLDAQTSLKCPHALVLLKPYAHHKKIRELDTNKEKMLKDAVPWRMTEKASSFSNRP